MTWTLPITGEYPANWKEISDATCAAVGHRCIRCGHPYEKGKHGKGQWTPCDMKCSHFGPLGVPTANPGDFAKAFSTYLSEYPAGVLVSAGNKVCAEWRILTCHHFDGNKANCEWWNLLPLCQRCHLQIQTRVNPHQPYMFEHSPWLQPYVAGFYSVKYEGIQRTRGEVLFDLYRLLALERIA